MGKPFTIVWMDRYGRITIPSKVRKKLGIGNKASFFVYVYEDEKKIVLELLEGNE